MYIHVRAPSEQRPSLIPTDKENILVNDSERACIADFGLSSVRTDQTIAGTLGNNTARGFSVNWAAPELLDDDARATTASDVWALGGVCFEVCVFCETN